MSTLGTVSKMSWTSFFFAEWGMKIQKFETSLYGWSGRLIMARPDKYYQV